MKLKRVCTSLLLILAICLSATLLAACNGDGGTDGGGGGGGSTGVSAPANLKYDGEALTWSASKGADHYMVSINGGEDHKVNSPLYIYNAMNQAFSVTVKAVKGDKSATTEKNFTPLGMVQNITVSGEKRLSWDSVKYANGYAVSIDGSDDEIIVSTNALDITMAGTHSYRIRAIMQGDDSYYSTFSAEKRLTVLGQVASNSITYSDDGYISWGYVTGATAYEVKINGIVVTNEKNQTATKYLYDAQNADFEVVVTALGDSTSVFNGAPSDAKRFMFLDTVTNIRVTDGVLEWDPVDKATGYKLKLNGRVMPEILTDTKYDKITEGVTTTVEIMGVCSIADTLSSWSGVTSVYVLPAPVLQWNSSYSSTEQETQSIFWDWSITGNLTGFNVKVVDPNGNETITSYNGDRRGYSNEYLQAGTYTISVQAVSSEEGVYSSRYSKTITVVRLASPEKVDSNFVTSNANDLSQGFTVTYKKNNNAVGYYLYCDGSKFSESTGNQFVVNNFYNASSIDQQTFDFKIVSKGSNVLSNGYVVIDSLLTDALSFSVTVLPTPLVSGMDGYNFNYTAVTGAYGYNVKVGGAVYESRSTSCSLSSISSGSYEVSVCAKGNGSTVLASNPSPAITVHRLDAPTNIRIDTSEASEGVITYDKVMYATGYQIVFNNDGNAIPADTINNINQYIKDSGVTVYMQSVANYYQDTRETVYYMTSAPGETYNFIKLAAPTFGNAPFTNSELIWNAPKNVNTNVYTPTYEVYLADGSSFNGVKDGTRMDITSLKGGNTYTFSVKAIGDGKTYINSDKSVELTITKLSTPNVTRTTTAYTWKGVPDAVSYAVYVDGVKVENAYHVSGDTYEYVPKGFNELKIYTVQIFAIGDNGYNTIDSDPNEIRQETRQLTTPEFTFAYDSESYKNDGKITVTLKSAVPNATAYSYTIAGVTMISTETTCSHCPGSVGEYQMRVYAIGGAFDSDGVYYIDSQSQGGNSRYRITLLASPNPSEMKLTRDGVVSWSAIRDANKYHITIQKDGVKIVDTDTSAPRYEIEDFALDHTYYVEVYAWSNDSTVINSETSYKEWTINS